MTTDQVYNLIILDESESMEPIKQSIIIGFNKIVRTIKEIKKRFPKQQQFISFVSFNGLGVKTRLSKKPAGSLAQINQNTYHPGSSAPLYDAIGRSVLKLKTDLAGKVNIDVLVTILSGGVENASKTFNLSQIRSIIDEQKKRGWTFKYIGANQDAWEEATSHSGNSVMQLNDDKAGVHYILKKENVSSRHHREKNCIQEALGQSFYNFNR